MVDAYKGGEWEKAFVLENVCIHATLLPTGKIIYWGRRSDPSSQDPDSLDEHCTKTYILDPETKISRPTATQPTLQEPPTKGDSNVNLFCSGHSLQADGSLFVVGGHLYDGEGVDSACVFDPATEKWSAKDKMNNGRWYPSALTLPDDSILSMAGSYKGAEGNTPINNIPQIWSNGSWDNFSVQECPRLNYPRLYLERNGGVFCAGPDYQSEFLDVKPHSVSTWSKGPVRQAGDREYGASVSYDSGKIMYIGGGGGKGARPTNAVEYINLHSNKPTWKPSKKPDMKFARRHHTATVLPDGSVLVTGGTQLEGFNNLKKGVKNPEKDVYEDGPVRVPELWSPGTEEWSEMAKESYDRCYHSIALLIPDGRVLSAGGGELRPDDLDNGEKNVGRLPNAPKDSIKEAQFYKPPYLFNGPRPTVLDAPSEVDYNQKFDVSVNANDDIAKASWIRLPSVTHSCNMNQSFQQQECKQQGSKVTVQAPDNHNLAPAGHYMLFLLNNKGVPAVAPIIRLKPAQAATTSFSARVATSVRPLALTLPEQDEQIVREQRRPHVVVGLTPVCPYGLGACWGGAYSALRRIEDIKVVRPVPSQVDSVAYVYLDKDKDKLPDIDEWRSRFQETTNGSHDMRGIEMTISGSVSSKQSATAAEQLVLAGTSTRHDLILKPFRAESKIEYDMRTQTPKPASEEEIGAYEKLTAALKNHPAGVEVRVTGRLHKHDTNTFSLDVREFEVLSNVTD